MTKQQLIEEIEKEANLKIFRIVSRIIGTAIQEGTLSGKYADDFSIYRNELKELFSQSLSKVYDQCLDDVIAGLDIGKIKKEIKEIMFDWSDNKIQANEFEKQLDSCLAQVKEKLEGLKTKDYNYGYTFSNISSSVIYSFNKL